MAKNKNNKINSQKPVSKTGESKNQPKKSTPSKKTIALKPTEKKKALGKVLANTKSSPVASSKTITKSAPVKKTVKPVSKNTAPTKLPSKKSPAPVQTIAQPSALKSKPVVNSQPDKENKKALSKNVEAPALPNAKSIKVPPPKPVVLPKINTTKARKYEPEFTKSVLDQAAPENNGPTMRYSDVELNEFRELIQRKLETAKKELGYLQGLITRKDEMGGDETDNRYMTMEDGSLSMEREQLSQMASRQITFIDHLEKAMMRIENKTYGICRVTGKLIDKARLRAVPHATLSIEAKMGIAK